MTAFLEEKSDALIRATKTMTRPSLQPVTAVVDVSIYSVTMTNMSKKKVRCIELW